MFAELIASNYPTEGFFGRSNVKGQDLYTGIQQRVNGDAESTSFTNFNDPSMAPDETWRSLGFTGQLYDGAASGSGVNGETPGGVAYGATPEFQQWLAANGYSVKGRDSGSGHYSAVMGRDGQAVTDPKYQRTGGWQDNLMFDAGVAGLGLGLGSYLSAAQAAGGVGGAAGAEAAGAGSAFGVPVADGLATGALGAEALAGMTPEAFAALVGGGEVTGGGLGALLSGVSGGSLASGALSLGGALINQYGAGKVADAQQRGADQANALQMQMYNQQRQDMAPYREAGSSALSQIQALLKDPSSVAQQPGYQFGLNEGTKALNAGGAARGMTYSGAQGKALQRYGQDYAGTKLNESYNRLSNLAGLGQVGATGSANAAGQYGQAVGQNLTGMGNARGSAFASTANGWTNALGQIGNSMQENQLLNLLKQQKVGP